MSNDANSSRAVLFGLIKAEKPNNVLWIGNISMSEQQLQEIIPADHTILNIKPIDTQQPNRKKTTVIDTLLKQLESTQRFDIVVVNDCLHLLSISDGQTLLARLRDVVAPKVLVAMPLADETATQTSNWEDKDWRAMGFAPVHEPTKSTGFYGFDIHSYKQTPDWLNSKYWANPQLFDKHFW